MAQKEPLILSLSKDEGRRIQSSSFDKLRMRILLLWCDFYPSRRAFGPPQEEVFVL
jgi:hypothetical protein